MKIIGVIGKAGVGKSTFLNQVLDELGHPIWKIDDLVLYLRETNIFFRTLLLYLCGSLDKDIVRKTLFEDPKKMKLVEKYVEERIKEELKLEELEVDHNFLFIEGTNLPSMNLEIDNWILLYCDEDQRVERLKKRNGESKANELIDFQKNLSYNNLENLICIDTSKGYNVKMLEGWLRAI